VAPDPAAAAAAAPPQQQPPPPPPPGRVKEEDGAAGPSGFASTSAPLRTGPPTTLRVTLPASLRHKRGRPTAAEAALRAKVRAAEEAAALEAGDEWCPSRRLKKATEPSRLPPPPAPPARARGAPVGEAVGAGEGGTTTTTTRDEEGSAGAAAVGAAPADAAAATPVLRAALRATASGWAAAAAAAADAAGAAQPPPTDDQQPQARRSGRARNAPDYGLLSDLIGRYSAEDVIAITRACQ